jgi:hypothetical protein
MPSKDSYGQIRADETGVRKRVSSASEFHDLASFWGRSPTNKAPSPTNSPKISQESQMASARL